MTEDKFAGNYPGPLYARHPDLVSGVIKNPDEIVLEDVKMVHYEVMEEGRAVWLGIYLNNGQIFHLNIGGDNLYVNYSDESNDLPTETPCP